MSEPSSESFEARLLEACRSGRLDKLQAMHDIEEEASPPPYEKMMIAAARHDRCDIVRYCLSKGARLTYDVVNTTAVSHAWQTYRVLVIDGGLDINQSINWLGDVLIIAVDHNQLDTVRFCLEHGANPNLHRVQDTMRSLGVAAASVETSVDVAALLIKYGARVQGSGAIVSAAEQDKIEMVKLLLEHGADVNEIGIKDYGDDRMDEDMGTPLHKVVGKRRVNMLKFLLDRGADSVRPDAQGRTPLQLAKDLGHEEEAAILERHVAAGGTANSKTE